MLKSFFFTLKLELALDDNRKKLIDLKQLRHGLTFSGYCIRERRSSKIGYLSLIQNE